MASWLRKWQWPLFYSVVFAVAIGVGWVIAKRSVERPLNVEEDASIAVETRSKLSVHLYFGDPKGDYLMAEQRVFDKPRSGPALGRILVQALIDGPRQRGTRTLPEGVELRSVFLVPDNDSGDTIAIVDLDAQGVASHPGGVDLELLTIYSIVNTLVFNMDDLRAVKLLVGGREADTLGGHVDLSHAFTADMLWVR
jgi:hypothetical protein